MARLIAGQGVERTDVAKNPAGTLVMTGSSQTPIAANKDRVGVYLSNNSATNKVFVAPGPVAANNAGIVIPAGQTLFLQGYTGAVSVFGTAADVLTYAEI